MAGIYIHIPFCKKACHYCNFHFSTSLHQKQAFLLALQKEIEESPAYHPYLTTNTLESIYFGGGTPSILHPDELEKILTAISHRYPFSGNVEITMEANPDDISSENLFLWKQLGINRLSIGVQSFKQQDLIWMNRAHNSIQAYQCIELAFEAGFKSLNIDLIYGTPTLTNEAWLQNLDMASTLGINHLSCYALTVEENTALSHFVKKGKVPAPSEQKQALHFEMLQQWSNQNGWEHYEISNLCKPGNRSFHNTNYWKGVPYAGFGPSAHSFNGQNTRLMGIANNALYIKAWLEKHQEPYQRETLTDLQRLNEKIMTGIRLLEGISVCKEKREIAGVTLSEKKWNQWESVVKKWRYSGHVIEQNNNIFLTNKGRLFADAIAADMFR